jgi:phage-related protein
MSYQNHSPSISIIFGSASGILTFMSEHGASIENFIQLFKVILFAVIGGIFGYVGKIIATRIHKFLK